MLELLLLNKRASTIETLFHGDKKALLHVTLMRVLDSIALFAADEAIIVVDLRYSERGVMRQSDDGRTHKVQFVISVES